MDDPAYCATCLSMQPADAAFCLRCGADLSLPPPRPVPPRPPRPKAEERSDFEEILEGALESPVGGGGLSAVAAAVVMWLIYKIFRALVWLVRAAWRAVRRTRAG